MKQILGKIKKGVSLDDLVNPRTNVGKWFYALLDKNNKFKFSIEILWEQNPYKRYKEERK